MKLNTFKPVVKPGLILLTLNLGLCTAFGLAAILALGLSWIFFAHFGIPFPLMPLVFIGFTVLSVAAWVVFGRRLEIDQKARMLTALAGASPLLAFAGIALLGALCFVPVSIAPTLTILAPVAAGVVATIAAAVCAACVIWTPQQKPKSDPIQVDAV